MYPEVFPVHCENESHADVKKYLTEEFAIPEHLLVKAIFTFMRVHQQLLSIRQDTKTPQRLPSKDKRQDLLENVNNLLRNRKTLFAILCGETRGRSACDNECITSNHFGSVRAVFDHVLKYSSRNEIIPLHHYHKLLAVSPYVDKIAFMASPPTDQKYAIADSDSEEFSAFWYVLENDYTKSSKGYAANPSCFERISITGGETDPCDQDSSSSDDGLSDRSSFVMSRYFKSLGQGSEATAAIHFEEIEDEPTLAEENGRSPFWGEVFEDFPKDQEFGSGFQLDDWGFDNPCFEDSIEDQLNETLFVHEQSSYIRMINLNWDSNMKDVSEETRQPKKVFFEEDSNLVTIRFFEPDDDGCEHRTELSNRIRFQHRIQEFGRIMERFLTSEHRENIFKLINSFNLL